MPRVRWFLILALLALCACTPGLGGADSPSASTGATAATAAFPASPVAQVNSEPTPEYRLVPGDLLDISVFQVPDLTKEVQVDPSGLITLPLIGDIKAAGMSPRALQQDITVKLKARYLQSPQVSVFLKTSAGQKVTVDGAVKTPGVYAIDGQMSLIQAIAHSGGFTNIADTNNVLVFRQVNGQRMAAKFNVGDIRAGKAADPDLQAGDLVIVDNSGTLSAWENVKTTIPAFAFFAPYL